MPQDQVGILYADIDLSTIAVAKAADDPSGHYARGDVVRLMVNRSPRRTSINFGEGVTDGGQWTEAKVD